ncbi:MAG TPA: S41 family peptidase, partial [Pyrinomonadaceae bacterium]|nr:S41 family peptidase [Pyrinomonadaceae bacterium]
GLKVGDIIQTINGFEVTRDSFWKIEYFFYDLMPVQKVNVVVQDQKGQVHQLEITTQTAKRPKTKIYEEDAPSPNPPEYYEEGEDLIVCKLREFDLNNKQVDEMMKKISQHKTLVLDLRRNPGGRLDMLKKMVAYLFDHDVKLGDTKSRKETLSYVAKTRGERSFKGKLIVLVDSKSASASEIFSRIVQIEKRGIVIGDKTAGAVMAGGQFDYALGNNGGLGGMMWNRNNLPILYGASITVADFIMSDGKSLERVGVRPDVMLLPSQDMVAVHRDPVMASAIGIAGIKMDAEKAATLFPLESKTELLSEGKQ